jgi:hypothetical protein
MAQASPAQPSATSSSTGLSRWLEVQVGTIAARARYMETSTGAVTARQVQYSGQVKARFRFDTNGRVSLTAMAAPGTTFVASWNATGLGTGDFVGTWSVKHLFATAVPVKGVEFSVGSMGFSRGESTEATSYDNDGYLTGERLCVRRPETLFFDELDVTSAFLGDTTTPAVWDRADRLTARRNYTQLLVGKAITKQLSASADYTRVSGVGTFRAAFSAKTPRARVIDSVRFEQYVRRGAKAANGFAVLAEKSPSKRFTVGIGFVTIDPDYGGMNSDRFGKGKRFYETAAFKVTRELTFQLFSTQSIDNDFAVPNHLRFDVVATYNVLGACQRAGILK